MTKAWYEALYEGFENYDQEPYTQNTRAEVDFLVSLLNGEQEFNILDLGCGTGRHALELSRRGFQVTGLDLSSDLIDQARTKARQENLPVKFLEEDARTISFEEDYQSVIMLCEGGFSLMETDQMDRMILRNTYRALKPGGRLIFTAPNALVMLKDLAENPDFDPLTFREKFTMQHKNSLGETVELKCSQRYYTFPELRWVLRSLGFRDIQYFAVTGEGYTWKSEIASDQFELGLTAVKP